MAAMETVRQGSGGARFAAACGVLSQYVKAAERAAAAAALETRRPAVVLPLMPGADVPLVREEEEPGPAPAPAAQLTISYAGRVVVLDAVPADKAAELLRVAAAAQGAPTAGNLPMARKASLQRFMEKRRGFGSWLGALVLDDGRGGGSAIAALSSDELHVQLSIDRCGSMVILIFA